MVYNCLNLHRKQKYYEKRNLTSFNGAVCKHAARTIRCFAQRAPIMQHP